MHQIAILCEPSSTFFIGAIETLLAPHYETKRFTDPKLAHEWGDAVWCEWAAENAAALTAFATKPVVVRLHRYEVDTSAFMAIDWSRVTALLVTSAHVFKRAEANIPNLSSRTKCTLVPSLIDLDKWTFANHANRLRPVDEPRKVGVVSFVHGRKQPGMWLQLLAALPGNFELHHAGEFQDRDFFRYLQNQIKLLGLEKQIFFHGLVTDVNAFWSDKDWCLSTSVDEGCPYNPIEAMACGVRPVLHSYEGADDQFPVEFLWSTLDEAVEQITEQITEQTFDAPACRRFVEERYSIAAWEPSIRAIFDEALRDRSVVEVEPERLFNPDVQDPFLSVCFLVRNEKKSIGTAIRSFVGVADEVCVLDTGSLDGTAEIAEAYGCRVERVKADQPFDFGKWRNVSIQMGRGKWIYISDGDEYLDSPGNLLEMLKGLPESCNAVAMPHEMIGGNEAEGASVIIRCMRGDDVRQGKIYYEYPIHHQLRGLNDFSVSTALTKEPWFDATESALRVIPALEKMLAQCSAPGLVTANGKALGGRGNERQHALLYLSRSHAMLGSAATEPEVRTKHFERAALYSGQLVDEFPGQIGAWLVLLAVVEQARNLLSCEPIVLKALMNHPRCKDLRWWRIRVDSAALAVLGSQREEYPLVPQRAPLYMPRLRDLEKFLMLQFPAGV